MASLGNRIVNSVFWLAIERWGDQAMMFVTLVLLGRLLGPDAIGLAVLAMVLPTLLSIPVTSGLTDALVRRKEIETDHLDSAFLAILGCGAVLMGLICLAATPAATLFRAPALAELIMLSSVVVFVQSLEAVPAALLKRHLQFRVIATRSLIGTVVGAGLGIALAFNGWGVVSIVIMQLARATIKAAIIIVWSDWRPKWRYSHRHLKDLVGFSGPIIASNFWWVLHEETQKSIIGGALGPAALGIYSLARRPLDLLTNVLVNPIQSVAMPAVARMQDDKEKIGQFFDQAIRLTALVGVPAFIGGIVVAPDLIPLALGDEWRAGVVPFQLLMLLGISRTFEGVCTGLLLALGKSGFVFKISVGYTVVITALVLIASQFSLDATVAAMVSGHLLTIPILLVFTHRLTGVDISKPFVLFPRLAAASALMILATLAWLRFAHSQHFPEFATVAAAVALGAAAYAAAMFAIARPDIANAASLLGRLRG